MRELVAWLLWCANQGYIKAEDRDILTNWFLDDPTTLHRDDLAQREGWLSMADEVLAAIQDEVDR